MCYNVPFSVVVNATQQPGCNFNYPWETFNVSQLIVTMNGLNATCIDALKNNFHLLNSTCLANYTATANELIKKTITTNIQSYADAKQLEWENAGCLCPDIGEFFENVTRMLSALIYFCQDMIYSQVFLI